MDKLAAITIALFSLAGVAACDSLVKFDVEVPPITGVIGIDAGEAGAASDNGSANGSGGSGSSGANGGGNGGSGSGGGGSGLGGTPTSTGGHCAMTVDGASVTDPPALPSAAAMLLGTELTIICSFNSSSAWGSLSFQVPNVTGAGTYTGANAYYEVYDGSSTAYCSHPPDAADTGCSVQIDSYAPVTKGGMTARFSCGSLSGNDLSTIAVAGSIALAPRTSEDAGAPPDAGSLNEAGAPSCTMSLHGQYEAADSVGWGNNYECTTWSSDGTSYSFTPGSNGYLSVAAAWCTTCGIDYQGTCTTNVEVDEGVGGRYAASFSCTHLTAGDGTSETLSGRIDGFHSPPPE